jgi:hypothetical protein
MMYKVNDTDGWKDTKAPAEQDTIIIGSRKSQAKQHKEGGNRKAHSLRISLQKVPLEQVKAQKLEKKKANMQKKQATKQRKADEACETLATADLLMSEEQLAGIKNCGLECQLQAWRQFEPFKGRGIKVGGRGPEMRKLLLELIAEVRRDHLALYENLRWQPEGDDNVQDLTSPPAATAGAPIAPPTATLQVPIPEPETVPVLPPEQPQSAPLPPSSPKRAPKRRPAASRTAPEKRRKPSCVLESTETVAQHFLQVDCSGQRKRRRSQYLYDDAD